MHISYEEQLNVIKALPAEKLQSAKVLVGFDSVCDQLVNIIRNRNEDGSFKLFETIKEFGDYVSGKAGMSCCLEFKPIVTKVGGNMAIMSLALSEAGVQTTCIGAVGEPGDFTHDALSGACRLYSVAPGGSCTALEFQDGKVMLSRGAFLDFSWQHVLEALGEEVCVDLFAQNDLTALVNWSEMPAANALWAGILDFCKTHGIGGKTVFFDLADFSARSEADVLTCVMLLKAYSERFHTILGLNENETRVLAGILGLTGGIEALGKGILQKVGIGVLTVHTNTRAYTFGENGEAFEGAAFLCRNPFTLTGAGDNYNAGFCVGKLLGAGLDTCTALANAASGYYVRYGRGAGFAELVNFIELYLKEAGQ